MIDQGESALPPFPFGALPDLPDGDDATGALPSWLALTGGPLSGPESGESSPPSLPPLSLPPSRPRASRASPRYRPP